MLSRLISRYWFLLPLLIVVVVAVDRIEAPATVEVEETINMRETRSDYYMSDFNTRKYAANGTIEYTVQGETLAHYPDNNRSEITAPTILLHRPEATWHISSNRGRFITNPDLFTLQGDVIVKRQSTGSGLITITTNSLKVATQTNEVTTDQDIEITAQHWQLNATGMTSLIDDGTLTLLSAVTGHYEMPDEP